MVLFTTAIAAHYLSGYEKYVVHIMFIFFLFAVVLFLPYAFFVSGGSNNNAIAYFFLLIIAITYLMNGWRRFLLVAALVVSFFVLHALEYYHPELVSVYPSDKQFFDRMIQVPLLLTVAFLIIRMFANEYEKVNARLHDLANYDELTGLYNRRMFNRAMEEALRDNDRPIQLVLLDLDNFKMANDKYGHFFGDKILQELAALLRKAFGLDVHVVSRWGGDEFAIIYYGTMEELERKLLRIKKALKARFASDDNLAGISTSIVSFRDYDDAAQILIAADRLLYREKSLSHTRG
jgi:diguanylate cyclase (GGDEF)-like protein